MEYFIVKGKVVAVLEMVVPFEFNHRLYRKGGFVVMGLKERFACSTADEVFEYRDSLRGQQQERTDP